MSPVWVPRGLFGGGGGKLPFLRPESTCWRNRFEPVAGAFWLFVLFWEGGKGVLKRLDSSVSLRKHSSASLPWSFPVPTVPSPLPPLSGVRPRDWESALHKCCVEWGQDCGWAACSGGPASREHSPNVLLPRASQMIPFSDWPRPMASFQSKRARIWAQRPRTFSETRC